MFQHPAELLIKAFLEGIQVFRMQWSPAKTSEQTPLGRFPSNPK
jgi:hypothetical protein